MFEVFFNLLIVMVGLYWLAEFPLQGTVLYVNKNPDSRIVQEVREIEPHPQWWLYMFAYACIHGLMIFLMTANWWMFLIMVVITFMLEGRVCNEQLGMVKKHVVMFFLIGCFAAYKTWM